MAHGENFQVKKGTIPSDAEKFVLYENVALALVVCLLVKVIRS